MSEEKFPSVDEFPNFDAVDSVTVDDPAESFSEDDATNDEVGCE